MNRAQIEMMNGSIANLFRNALGISAHHPGWMLFVAKALVYQKRASVKRIRWEDKGVHVPPFAIASITSKCNLRCKGCYARTNLTEKGLEMTLQEWKRFFDEASDLGISLILLAGGEPLVRSDMIALAAEYPRIIFPVFTNGLLLDEEKIRILKKHKNIIPVISVEGLEDRTDTRRGAGVWEKVTQNMQLLKKHKIFFGVSVTLTQSNFDTVTGGDFVKNLKDKGCRLFFYVEYIPVDPGTENQVVTVMQRGELDERTPRLKKEHHCLFVSFPGDEKKYGGCLSSGRGFVHVNPQGGLEPCPFAPYSDVSLKNSSLKEALQSTFLSKIRNSPEHLSELEGGCALWNQGEWVKSLLRETKA